jgi:hypothetical protein
MSFSVRNIWSRTPPTQVAEVTPGGQSQRPLIEKLYSCLNTVTHEHNNELKGWTADYDRSATQLTYSHRVHEESTPNILTRSEHPFTGNKQFFQPGGKPNWRDFSARLVALYQGSFTNHTLPDHAIKQLIIATRVDILGPIIMESIRQTFEGQTAIHTINTNLASINLDWSRSKPGIVDITYHTVLQHMLADATESNIPATLSITVRAFLSNEKTLVFPIYWPTIGFHSNEIVLAVNPTSGEGYIRNQEKSIKTSGMEEANPITHAYLRKIINDAFYKGHNRNDPRWHIPPELAKKYRYVVGLTTRTTIATYMPFSLANQAMKLGDEVQAYIDSLMYKAKSLVGEQRLRQIAMEFQMKLYGKATYREGAAAPTASENQEHFEYSKAKELYGKACSAMGLAYCWGCDVSLTEDIAKKFNLCRALVEHGKKQYPRTFTDYQNIAELSRPQRLRFRIPPEVTLFRVIEQIWHTNSDDELVRIVLKYPSYFKETPVFDTFNKNFHQYVTPCRKIQLPQALDKAPNQNLFGGKTGYGFHTEYNERPPEYNERPPEYNGRSPEYNGL